MLLKKNLFFLFCFLHVFSIAGQTLDFETYIYNKAHYFSNINTDSLLFYSKEMLKSKDFCTNINGKINIATSYYKMGDFAKAEIIALKTLDELKYKNSDCIQKNKFNLLGRLFWINKNQGKLNQAFDFLTQNIELIEKSNNKNNYYLMQKSSLNSNLAQLKFDLGFEEEAIKIIKNVINNYSLISFNKDNVTNNYSLKIHRANSYNILGDFFLMLNSKENNIHYLDSSLIYYKKAYDKIKNINPKHKNSEYQYNLELTKVLIKKEKFDTALSLLNLNKYNDINISQDTDFLKSLTYKNLNNVDSSMYYAYKFLDYKKRVPSTEKNKIVIYNILANLYNIKNEIDSAYKYSLLAKNKLDKFYDSKNKAYKKHYLYDFNQIKTVNDSILKNEKRIRNSLLFFSSIILVLLAVFFVFFYKQYHRLKKSKKALENEKAIKTFKPLKKEYSVNKELEEMVLKKLLTFEQSRLYLDSKFSIQVLAKKFKTNTTYLSSIINEKKGKTFKHYITELRIHYLLQELEKNPKIRKYTIKALGQEIGYTNASAFTRAFKNFIGTSPSKYMAYLKEKNS